jgi:hypothetical protein
MLPTSPIRHLAGLGFFCAQMPTKSVAHPESQQFAGGRKFQRNNREKGSSVQYEAFPVYSPTF